MQSFDFTGTDHREIIRPHRSMFVRREKATRLRCVKAARLHAFTTQGNTNNSEAERVAKLSNWPVDQPMSFTPPRALPDPQHNSRDNDDLPTRHTGPP